MCTGSFGQRVKRTGREAKRSHHVCKGNFTFTCTLCASEQFIYFSYNGGHDTLTFRNLLNIAPNYKVSQLRIENKEFNSNSLRHGLGVATRFVCCLRTATYSARPYISCSRVWKEIIIAYFELLSKVRNVLNVRLVLMPIVPLYLLYCLKWHAARLKF